MIDERLDLDLLAEIADLRPDWTIALIGPVTKIDETTIPVRSNIVRFGQQAYDDLPAFLACFDVALMPFARNEATRAISPPRRSSTWRVASRSSRPRSPTSSRSTATPSRSPRLEEFVAAAESVLTRTSDADRQWRARAARLVAAHDWDCIASEMLAVMSRASTTMIVPAARPPRFRPDPAMFDFLIVGAGFAGSVLAERLAREDGARVLLIDRRSHIAGNAFDTFDDAGILIHRYGPHIFHANSPEIFEYLSQFTEWRPYQHRVLASVEGRLVPIPINLDTINTLFGMNLTSDELACYFERIAEPRERILTAEDAVVSKVGRHLYNTFFRGYTRKQWGVDPPSSTLR